MSSDQEFLKTLRATFKLEAAEHVQAIASGLLALEKSPLEADKDHVVQRIFRAAHSLKGAARAVDFFEVESLCQEMEETFAGWRTAGRAPGASEINQAHVVLDAMSTVLNGETTAPEPEPTPAAPASKSFEALPKVAEEPATPREETVRLAVSKLETQLLHAEEMLATKLLTTQRAVDVRSLIAETATFRSAWVAAEPMARSVRSTLLKLAVSHPHLAADGLRLVDFVQWNAEHQQSLETRLTALGRSIDQDALAVSKQVDDLLEQSKQLLLLPFGTLAAQFPKLVRDLCHDQGKQADFILSGEDVEMDKRILEEMKDPLVHLLRNCVDHGIESPEQRAHAGKPARATIKLTATQINGRTVQLDVTDDGAGIDIAQVREVARERGAVAAHEADALDDQAIAQLVFEPELSTSTVVTRLSGRGLGLAIVRERAQRLGGRVSVETRRGAGTRFSLSLPSTVATLRGVVVEAAQQRFVIPTSHLERVARIATDQIGTVEGRPTVSLGDRAVAFARLESVLKLPPRAGSTVDSGSTTVIVLGSGDHRIAFAVDLVLDEHEVLVKPFSKPLMRLRHFAGATILPSGHVVLIINVADVLKSARDLGVSALPLGKTPAAAAQPAAKSILVAEDSITSRMLMTSILESAGFKVTTAVDGMDAFAQLRTGDFDLLVSDVEMPRLNGFDLTARVRAEKRLAELPIILVTALETPDDRARGIDVGADAYLVKSRFDQRDLVDAVRRLV